MHVQDSEDDAIKLGGLNEPMRCLNNKVSTTCEKYKKKKGKSAENEHETILIALKLPIRRKTPIS